VRRADEAGRRPELLGPAICNVAGIVLVIVVQFGLVSCCGLFNPVLASYRLEQTATDRVARTVSAWSVTSKVSIATVTALWGLLASFAGVRIAIGLAGALLLATPLLLPRRDPGCEPGPIGELSAGTKVDNTRPTVSLASPAVHN